MRMNISDSSYEEILKLVVTLVKAGLNVGGISVAPQIGQSPIVTLELY